MQLDSECLVYEQNKSVQENPIFWRGCGGLRLTTGKSCALIDKTGVQAGTATKDLLGVISYELTNLSVGQKGKILDRFDALNVFQFSIEESGLGADVDITGFSLKISEMDFDYEVLGTLGNKGDVGSAPVLFLTESEYATMKTNQKEKKDSVLPRLMFKNTEGINDTTSDNDAYSVNIFIEHLNKPNEKLEKI